MDIWVVAAAAGAGYVAQHCKSIVKGRHSFSDSSCRSPTNRAESSSITQRVKDNRPCPCSAGHSYRQDEDLCPDIERLSRVTSTAEKASNYTKCRNHVTSSDCADSCTCSGSNLLLGNPSYEDIQGIRVCGDVGESDRLLPGIPSYEDIQGIRVCGDVGESDGDNSVLPSTREIIAYGFKRKKSSLRSIGTNRQSLKPLNSLESCLMAQLYKGHTKVEDYTSMTPPCTPTVRPFPVPDCGRIISRSTGDSFSSPVAAVRKKFQTSINSQDTRMILGVPPLPSVGSLEFQRKGKTQMKMEQRVTLCNSIGVKEKHKELQGLSHGALLFCLGMSIGLVSSVLNNKREVDNLSDLLKQTESLIQDLQEELEMKDSLTVKELAVEDCESQDTLNDAFKYGPLPTCSPDEKLDDHHNENNTQKAEEESFSKIEAELEAELERLELNISSCSLDRKMLNLAGLDADYVPHAVKGELKADILGKQSGPQPHADRDGSGSSTPHSVHYAVSPRELTLRLHEVIQSRLEQRVEELEIALQNSQMKVRYMESQDGSYFRELSNGKSRHSSIKGSPVVKVESHADQPVVINLSGEALDDEYTQINEFDEEDAPPVGKDSHQEKILQPSEQKIYWHRNSELKDAMRVKSSNEKLMLANQQVQGDDNYLPNGFLTRGDEDDNGYDEMEELLIKHIVEQARKGSPVVLNAQRALSSPDENEHSQ